MSTADLATIFSLHGFPLSTHNGTALGSPHITNRTRLRYELTPELHYEDDLEDICWMNLIDFSYAYLVPFIIGFGLVGNLLSCVVFLHTHLKMRSSSYYYLAALATADFSFLVTCLLVWLENHVDVRIFNVEGWCQSVVYVSSVCSFLSVWLIVAFTVERFIAVQYPLHRPHMCTVRRAKLTVLGLTGLSVLLHAYTFFTAGVVREEDSDTCALVEHYHELMRVINFADTLLTLILPIVLIIVMNVMITRNLIVFSRRFNTNPRDQEENTTTDRDNVQPNPSSSSNSRLSPSQPGSFHSSRSSNSRNFRCNNNQTKIEMITITPNRMQVRTSNKNVVSTRTQRSITKMLLLISTVFILLNLPSYVVRLYTFVGYSLKGESAPPSIWCMQQFAMILYYTNFSINFLLYSMCGITFRRCLWQLLRKIYKKITSCSCNVMDVVGCLRHCNKGNTGQAVPSDGT